MKRWGRVVVAIATVAMLAAGRAPAYAQTDWSPPQWEDLSAYEQRIITALLPADPGAWDQDQTFSFLSAKGTRSATYLALGMLLRDGPSDRENAAALVRAILKLQVDRPGKLDHGVWRSGPGSERLDQNWREFIGVGLIMLREWFPAALDAELAAQVEQALTRAAEGASVRDVGHDYTNIALMSALLIEYAGHMNDNAQWIDQGREKAQAIRDGFFEHGTFTEYNSPTYYGVNLMGLGLWCRLARSSELRDWGGEIEAAFWRDIGQFYHADLRNLCGPYSRAYGMDMTTYPAIVGLLMAVALEGQDAPLPEAPVSRLYEWAYAPVFALLDRPIPAEVVQQLHSFEGPRQLSRSIAADRRRYAIEARLERDWMMGVVTGMNRPWEQHCPATIHWKTGAGDEVGWLLVHGTSGADARIVNDAIHVSLPRPSSRRELVVYCHDPTHARLEAGPTSWTWPDMAIEFESSLDGPVIKPLRDARFGQVMAATWQVPNSQSPGQTVLILRPTRKD